jgi:hypothetical protein
MVRWSAVRITEVIMYRLLVVTLAVCVVLPCAAWAGIVTNGGFESGSFSGWTQSGNTEFTSVDPGAGANGSSYFASFGPEIGRASCRERVSMFV